MVVATIDGRAIEIDFLSDVMGVAANALERDAIELIVPVRADGADHLTIPVMHPLHCLQSRIANIASLGRGDPVALRQLAAAPIVLHAYVDEMLSLGDPHEAMATLQHLFRYLRGDIAARAVPALPMTDPATILTAFIGDRRLDWRFRWFNLRATRRTLKAKRARHRIMPAER